MFARLHQRHRVGSEITCRLSGYRIRESCCRAVNLSIVGGA